MVPASPSRSVTRGRYPRALSFRISGLPSLRAAFRERAGDDFEFPAQVAENQRCQMPDGDFVVAADVVDIEVRALLQDGGQPVGEIVDVHEGAGLRTVAPVSETGLPPSGMFRGKRAKPGERTEGSHAPGPMSGPYTLWGRKTRTRSKWRRP